jgi:hypothetical protein
MICAKVCGRHRHRSVRAARYPGLPAIAVEAANPLVCCAGRDGGLELASRPERLQPAQCCAQCSDLRTGSRRGREKWADDARHVPWRIATGGDFRGL